jgi:hypothetical protein
LSRIYLGLAIVSLLLLLANIGLGLWTGDYGEAATRMFVAGNEVKTIEQSPELDLSQHAAADARRAAALEETLAMRGRVATHMLLGVAASLIAILVNSISVTYFVGTSRWCKEVVEAYHLDRNLAEESQRLKRRTFPWAVGGMLTIVAIVALGALSDPSVFSDPAGNPARHLSWRTYHYLCALLGTGFLAYAFYIQQQNIGANYAVIERIVAEVQRIRAERGLDVDDAAKSAAKVSANR